MTHNISFSRKILSLLLIILFPFIHHGQTPTEYIADWKGDARAAYSIVHDDYGLSGADGIWQYGDTIAYNRGIKFVFGAYTDLCESRFVQPHGYANLYDYAKNVMMAKHGHEIANHSSSHACAVERGWEPCTFSDGESGWGEAPLGADLDREINKAHNSIITGTGFVPKYYVYPYDNFTNATNQRLEDLGYLGSRTGWSSPSSDDYWAGYHREGYEMSDLASFYPNSNGFFRNGVQVFDDNDANMDWEDQLTELNNEIDHIIANNLYANREFHNVGNSGWGHVKVDAYRGHMDYLKAKVEAGDLWVGTASEIFTYQMQKLKFQPVVNYDNQTEKIVITWNSINPQYSIDISSYLGELVIKEPITLVIDLDGLDGTYDVKQNNLSVSPTLFHQKNGKMYIDIYPHEGSLELFKVGELTNTAPVVANSLNNISKAIGFNEFTIDLFHVFEDYESSDHELTFSAFGYSGITITIEGGSAKISAPSNWSGETSIRFRAEDPEGLSVEENVSLIVSDLFEGQTPFGGTAVHIPGKIEVEDYDEGGSGVAYNEQYSEWAPAPNASSYRPYGEVDIESITGGYAVGYTVAGEWLEYTIDVQANGWYNVNIRIAQNNDGFSPVGEFELFIDGIGWMPKSEGFFTGGWTMYDTFRYDGGLYLEKGKHILKLSFVKGNINVDYIEILANLTTVNKVKENDRKIYPNPAQNFATIEGDFSQGFLYDQKGSLVNTFTTNQLDLRNVENGIYFIKFDTSSEVMKFIVSK